MKLHELQATRQDHFEACESLIKKSRDAGKDLAGADLEQYQNHIREMKALDGVIARCQQLSGMKLPENDSRVIIPIGTQRENRRGSNLRDAFSHATAEEREQVVALAAYLGGDIRAVADLTPSGDGGVLIPSVVQESMEKNYSAFSPVVSVARIWGTDGGNDAVFPVLSDSESAAQLAPAAATGADATVSGDAPPTEITGPKLGAWKISSKPVFIPRETITDSPIDIVNEVLGALFARVTRYENLQYTSGDGTTEAEGFLTNCSTHAAGAVALDLDIALDLAYTVPALYRPNGVYMASDTTIKYLRKLKTGITGDKQQLWADADATKNTPATLHGYPIYVNNDMDSVAADGTFAAKSPLAFGDFKRFVVRQAEMGRGYIYRYSVPAKDGSAVILFRRSDSALLVSTAICKLIV
jgi:HK97 family phage major capsid protein